MTPRELLVELAGIAVLCIGWTALTLLMIERDRKRTERRAHIERLSDSHQGAEASESRPSSSRSTKEPRGSAAAQEDNREIQPS